MEVHKIEVLVIDLDGIGKNDVQSAIENARYPNRCISLDVMSIETREVDWSDEHPLNNSDKAEAEYKRLFG